MDSGAPAKAGAFFCLGMRASDLTRASGGSYLAQGKECARTVPALHFDLAQLGGNMEGSRGSGTARGSLPVRPSSHEDGLRAFVEKRSEGNLILDREGRIVSASPSAARILCRSTEELVGRSGLDLVDAGDRDSAIEAARRCLETPGSLVRAQVRVRHGDGWLLHLDCVAANHLLNPTVGAAVVNIRDVSEHAWVEEALRDSDRFSREIISNAGEGIVVYDRQLRCLVWNSFMEELTGLAAREVIGKPALDSFPALRERGVDRYLARALCGETVPSIDVEYPMPRSGKSGWLSSTYGPHRNAEGKVVGVIGVLRDVTDRRRAERRLQVFSDLGLRLGSSQTAVEAAGVIAGCADELWQWDACTVDLYSAERGQVDPLLTVDVIGGKRRNVSPVRVSAPPTPRQQRVLEEGAVLILREEPGLASDSIPFGDAARLSRSIMSAPIRHGASVVGFISVHSYTAKAYERQDLESLQALADFCGGSFARIAAFEELRRGEQKRREAENRLRRSNRELRALSARLGTVREEESARIARAVHDEVGQALTALKLDLAWVQQRLASPSQDDSESLAPKLQAMAGLVDSTLDAVHRISTELRPGVLHELGLEAAVGWYAREFEKRTNIRCRIHSELNAASLDDPRSTAAFRIFQEILTNVARHAAATEVDVVLRIDGGALALDARDNGRGIPQEKISDSRCLGLLGMRERARSFGGNVSISPDSEGGTAVRMRIPL